MSIAIITGASSGLGTAYVDAVVKLFPEIEELWLIARRENRLRDIADKYSEKKCVPISMDMSKLDSFSILEEKLKTEKPKITLLINDAGISHNESFEETSLEKMMGIIDLNCKGATAITRICLPYVVDGGTILEVSSTSAFVPNTNLVVYSASKSYVYEMCIGLRQELKSRRINVCAVCPGMMKTEMNTNPTKGQSRLPEVNVQKAAEKSLKAAKRGKAVYTTGIFYKFYRFLAKIIPQTIMVRFTGLD